MSCSDFVFSRKSLCSQSTSTNLRRDDISLIFLRLVLQVKERFLPEIRVGVKVEFGVHAEDFAGHVFSQRVDLAGRHVAFQE